jgi:hypothetical protein
MRDWWLAYQLSQPQHAQELAHADSALASRLFNAPRVSCRLVLEHLSHMLKQSSSTSNSVDTNKLLYMLSVSLPANFRLEYVLFSNEFLLEPDWRVFEFALNTYETFFAVPPVNSNASAATLAPPFLCLLASLGQVEMIRSVLDKFNVKLSDFSSLDGNFFIQLTL